MSGADRRLTDRDRAILDYERTWRTAPYRKGAVIRERFGLSASRYYEIVNQLSERPEAMEYDPLVVRRLRRDRGRRRRVRFTGRQEQQR
jgi:hypothetical protein